MAKGKKAVEAFLAFLKENDVEAGEIEDSIKAKFADQVIAEPDSVLSDGEIAVEKAKFDATEMDMMQYKNERNKLQKRVDELRDQLSTDGEKLRQENEKLKKRLDAQSPIIEAFNKQQKEIWEGVSDAIPDDVSDVFRWPDDEDSELSPEDVNFNVGRLNELIKLKSAPIMEALDLSTEEAESDPSKGGGKENLATMLRGGKGKPKKSQDFSGLTAAEKMEAGFKSSKNASE